MKKLILIFLLFTFYFLLFTSPAQAANFSTDYDVTYEVLKEGLIHVIQNVKLTNNTDNLYPADYTLLIEGTEIKNVQGEDAHGSLTTKVIPLETAAKAYTISVVFNKKALGKGSKISWNLEYDALDLAKKEGRILEINLPRFSKQKDESSEITSCKITLKVPKDFGEENYISPKPSITEHSETHWVYQYNLSLTDSNTPITVTFGDYQIFDFFLKYHLKNPHSTNAITEIALLPDFLPYQQIYINKLIPQPKAIKLDDDGNYLASYQLQPKEELTVIYKGQAKISSKLPKPQGFGAGAAQSSKLEDDLKEKYLQATEFWEVDALEIKTVINDIFPDPNTLADTPSLEVAHKIYNYVTTELSYNPDRISPEVKRLGAVETLKNKSNAVCMEFSDTTITLMRAVRIPTRELDGFAYSKNEKERPTATDTLHSWVQIYLDDYGWLNIDPTWGATSKEDYFSKLDTNHLIFVIKGLDPEKPYPAGSYKTETNEGSNVSVTPSKTRGKNTIPFALWWQNWEREKEKVDPLDLIFRFVAKIF